MKPYLLILVPLWPFIAQANELQLACNLARSQAEVEASTAAAPYAYGSLGQDPATGTKSASVGISQSFAGRARASLIREAAESKCDALRSTLQLEEHGRWSLAEAERLGARVELERLDRAIDLAKTNIAELEPQLAASTITIGQMTDARVQLAGMENRRADILRLLANPVQRPPQTNIASLLESARMHEGNTARLAAQASAQSGWDIVVSAGARQPFEGGGATPFASIGFKYSFGKAAADRAAIDVGRNTELLSAAQSGGFTQTVLRQRTALRGLVDAEVTRQTSTQRHMVELNRVLSSIQGLDTVLAQNMRRSLVLELMVLEAERAGSVERQAQYRKIQEKLE